MCVNAMELQGENLPNPSQPSLWEMSVLTGNLGAEMHQY